jgi:hypothetical protein
MKWPGPYSEHGGISQSIITKFLECPYRFYLWAGLGLREPEKLHPNLIWGDVFHKGLELILRKGMMRDFSEGDWHEIDDGVEQYLNTQYSQAPDTYLHTIQFMLRLYDDSFREDKIIETEIKFNDPYLTTLGDSVIVRGKLDGLSDDHTMMIEHKCKGRVDFQQARKEIPTDLQVNLYALIKEPREVIYDIIAIPEAKFSKPYRKQYQRGRSYALDLIHDKAHGDFPVAKKRHLWFDQFPTFLTDEGIQEHRQFTLDPIIHRMCRWYDHCTQPDFDPDNPKFYNDIFYRVPIRHFDPSQTEKFKCTYHGLLTGDLDMSDLLPVGHFYPELQDD